MALSIEEAGVDAGRYYYFSHRGSHVLAAVRKARFYRSMSWAHASKKPKRRRQPKPNRSLRSPRRPFVPKTSPSPHTLVASDPLTTSTPYTAAGDAPAFVFSKAGHPGSSDDCSCRCGTPGRRDGAKSRKPLRCAPKLFKPFNRPLPNRAAVYNLTLVLDISGDSAQRCTLCSQCIGSFRSHR